MRGLWTGRAAWVSAAIVSLTVGLTAVDATGMEPATLTLSAAGSDEGRLLALLQVDLAPDWKTYWRSPGQAGVPLQVDWSESRNVSAVEVLWPAPIAFDSFGLRTYGYADHVTFPIAATATDPTQPAELRLDVKIAACDQICVFLMERLDVALEETAADPSAREAALATVPASGPSVDAAIAACDWGAPESAPKGMQSFSARLDPSPSQSPSLVLVESSVPPYVGEARWSDDPEGGAWIEGRAPRRDGGPLVLTLVADAGSVEIVGC